MLDAVTTEGAGGSATAAPREGGAAMFYRYRDPDGRLVIVDSLARVPARARGSVESVVLARSPDGGGSITAAVGHDLHVPSFAAGLGSGLLLVLLWSGLRRSRTRLLGFGLLAAAVLLGAGAYLGWLRRIGGQDGSLVATPAALIEDARSAVEKMNARAREQQRVLDELESQH